MVGFVGLSASFGARLVRELLRLISLNIGLVEVVSSGGGR